MISQREPVRVAPTGALLHPAPAGVTGAGNSNAVNAQADALVGSARQADRCELSTVLCPSGYSATFAEYEKTPDAGDQRRPLPPYSNTPAAAYAAEDRMSAHASECHCCDDAQRHYALIARDLINQGRTDELTDDMRQAYDYEFGGVPEPEAPQVPEF